MSTHHFTYPKVVPVPRPGQPNSAAQNTAASTAAAGTRRAA
ncbi:hypothetical protein DSM112329_03436 [Paraconexibacter sp. AEG42_29]|uniref:Uncharacterized protein n=1 Tax=Paraconexibacter sp. AEG42_29 TaxID=2997339 RepID=A0AAU7AY26_9ACTN